MAGTFEIAQAGDKAYFFRLTAADGTVVAVSPLFSTIKGAAAGITAVRENAATGLVVDRSEAPSSVAPSSGMHGSGTHRLETHKRVATGRPAVGAPAALVGSGVGSS